MEDTLDPVVQADGKRGCDHDRQHEHDVGVEPAVQRVDHEEAELTVDEVERTSEALAW